jgi:hypothetical protein
VFENFFFSAFNGIGNFFLPARAHGIVCAARSAASCRFSGISDKMGSSQTVKTHQIPVAAGLFTDAVRKSHSNNLARPQNEVRT